MRQPARAEEEGIHVGDHRTYRLLGVGHEQPACVEGALVVAVTGARLPLGGRHACAEGGMHAERLGVASASACLPLGSHIPRGITVNHSLRPSLAPCGEDNGHVEHGRLRSRRFRRFRRFRRASSTANATHYCHTTAFGAPADASRVAWKLKSIRVGSDSLPVSQPASCTISPRTTYPSQKRRSGRSTPHT